MGYRLSQKVGWPPTVRRPTFLRLHSGRTYAAQSALPRDMTLLMHPIQSITLLSVTCKHHAYNLLSYRTSSSWKYLMMAKYFSFENIIRIWSLGYIPGVLNSELPISYCTSKKLISNVFFNFFSLRVRKNVVLHKMFKIDF